MEYVSIRKRKRELDRDDKNGELLEASESEEEYDFENIDLEEVAQQGKDVKAKSAAADLTVQLEEQDKGKLSRRYPSTAIARKVRFEIHKLHLLCLMAHVSIRNRWCSDDEVARILQPVKQRFRGNVHPRSSSAQIQRTRVLLEGLEAVSDLWSNSYKITSRGLSKPKWYTAEDFAKIMTSGTQLGVAVSKEDFHESARRLEGDRDIGAQLFVALLRSLGLTTRLVCSLQSLGLSVNRSNIAVIVDEPIVLEADPPPDDLRTQKQPKAQPRKLTKPRLGIPNRKPPPTRPKPQVKLSEPIFESPFPIYWAEVFDEATQKWYPVDPLVTGTVNKADKFEPPQSEADNNLSYVVGFESGGSARDVTHRYTKQFNAKLRKTRLESTPSGTVWWSKLMKLYRARYRQDRDAIEDSELAQRALSEGIPSNITDLKGHPLFVLERHLRKDEVIQPMRDCGTIRIGKTQPPIVEKVYPRKHLLKLRSSLAWYMRGRQVRIGEVPMKIIERQGQIDPNGSDELPQSEAKTESLFAHSQTDVYVAPPVHDGIVPKNTYGNVDLFQSSMLPPGSTHMPSRDAERIAQILGIDYAVAITGFDHANRMTVPVRTGIVVASEYVEAIEAVQVAMLEEAEEAVERAKTLDALKRWSHFLRSLRIRDHVERRYGSIE